MKARWIIAAAAAAVIVILGIGFVSMVSKPDIFRTPPAKGNVK